MSGQWELVSRNKKDKSNNQSTKKQKNNNTKNEVPPPKVEDILPMPQVKKLFSMDEKISKKNAPQEKPKKTKEVPKKPAAKKPEKQDPPKPKPPKSIESALNTINTQDFESNLTHNMKLYPDAPTLWLKDLCNILNVKMPIDAVDPVFSKKPDNYPLCVVPTSIKQVMERALKLAGKPCMQLFFDVTVIAMASEMATGHAAIGHKIWIQFLALNNPQICSANLVKHAILKTSYQNRQPIGLSILWSFGQGGVKDFGVGFKVFKEYMRSMLEKKNYSKYVIKYLSMLLHRHPTHPISIENYWYLYDLINEKKSIPQDAVPELLSLNKSLKTMILTKGSEKKFSVLFKPMLAKLETNMSANLRNEICNTLVTFLSREPNCFTMWEQAYSKHISQSKKLLAYFSENWTKISTTLDKKLLKKLLQNLCVINAGLSPKSDPESLAENITHTCKSLIGKMEKKKQYPWKLVSFVIAITIGSLLTYDITQNGSWKQSQSAYTLKKLGVWEYGELAWDRAHKGFNWTRERIEEYAPGYINVASELLKPYAELSQDLGLVLYNVGDTCCLLIVENTPIMIETLKKFTSTIWEHLQFMLMSFRDVSIEYWNHSYDYLATEVFIGQLSPQNMQKVMWQAMNVTQQYTIDCYEWIAEKVTSVMEGK